MALSAKIPLAAPVREVARFLVGRIPQHDLEVYAATSGLFASGGFRKGGNLAVVRTRVIQKIEGSELIDASLRRLLAERDEGCAVISKLAEGIVRDNVRAFELYFGYAPFQFSALLDGRFEDLRFTPCPESGVYPEITDADRTWAATALSEALWPLSGTSLPLGGAGASPLPSSSMPLGGSGSSPSFEASRQLRSLQAEVSRLKGVETRLEKEQKARAAAEAAAAKGLARAEEAESERGAWRQRAERAEAELARNKGDAEAQTAAIIETRLAQGFASWLGEARAARLFEAFSSPSPSPSCLSSGVSLLSHASCLSPSSFSSLSPSPSLPSDPLLSRFAAALAAQARADLAAGSRHVLEARLEAYEAARARSRALLADALDPQPALVEVEKELAAEIVRIRKLLGQGSPAAADPEEALQVAINAAPDSQLPELRHTAGKLRDLGVLADEAVNRLDEAVRRRYAVLYSKRGGPGLEKGDKLRPAEVLRCALRGQVPAMLLIDAHNVLYALQGRYSRPQDHRGPCAEAREWLVGDIVQMVSNAPNCRVIIVFDGPERTESTPSGNVKVIYSGGAKDKEHRADDVIVDEARFLVKADPSCNFLLATNDGGLSGRAASLGVRNISPNELLNYLR